MLGHNSVSLIGIVANDLVLRKTAKGMAVCNMRLSTEEQVKEQTHTEYHNVVVWGAQAEACVNNLKQGRQVYVEGKLRTRTYDKAINGTTIKMPITEIMATRVLFLDEAPRKKQEEAPEHLDDHEQPEMAH